MPAKRARSARESADASEPQGFAVCVRNQNYPASLELRKLYPVLEDQFAEQHGLIRVVDESGEDYLFPVDYFVRVRLPATLQTQLGKIA